MVCELYLNLDVKKNFKKNLSALENGCERQQ